MAAKRTVADRFGRFQFASRLISDSLMALLAWFLSYYIRFFVLLDGQGDQASTLFFSALSLLALVSTIFFNYANKLYETNMTSHWRKETGALIKTSIELFVVFVIFYYFFFNLKISRIHIVLFTGMAFCFLVLGRYVCNKIFASKIKAGKFKANVLIVGNGSSLNAYYKATLTASETGRLRVVAQYAGGCIEGVETIEAATLAEAVEKSNAEVVVIDFNDETPEVREEIRKQALELYEQTVYFLPDLPHAYVGTTISDFHYIPMLEVNCHSFTFGKRFIKRTFDILASLIGIILLSPLFVIIAILIKLTSKGPILFKQVRVTRDGELFKMLKFRSMRIDMPEQGGAHWTEEDDPRITKLGRLLRKTSLDEIPQFFNVLAGSMSLIGPRPERPELVDQFAKEIPGYNMRHRVKAGISGWAQVNGFRGNTSLEKRIDFDLYYIRNWTPLFDLRIVVLTFVKGFVNKNAY